MDPRRVLIPDNGSWESSNPGGGSQVSPDPDNRSQVISDLGGGSQGSSGMMVGPRRALILVVDPM